MKYISYRRETRKSIGIWQKGKIFDIPGASRSFGNRLMADTMLSFLQDFELNHRLVSDMFSQSDPGSRPELFFPDGQAVLDAPLPNPQSVRVFAAYSQHRNTLAQHMGQDEIDGTAFAFANHQMLQGAKSEVRLPEGVSHLDFEVQIAAVIARQGSDLNADNYQDHIAGFLLHTQLIARDAQAKELSRGLGLAKSIDLPAVSGPYLVSKEVFPSFRRDDVIEDDITILLNSEELTFAQTGQMDTHFAALVTEASRNSTLFPGDLISTGGLPGGSLVSSESNHFLAAGDTVRIISTELGEQKIHILE